VRAGRWEWRGLDLLWFCRSCPGAPEGHHPSVERCHECGDVRPVDDGDQAAFRAEVETVLSAVLEMLMAKNAAYGDSALSPLRVFSRASAVEQLLVRIDDKLSRLMRGTAAGEDVELDLLGYLVLLRVARTRAEVTRG